MISRNPRGEWLDHRSLQRATISRAWTEFYSHPTANRCCRSSNETAITILLTGGGMFSIIFSYTAMFMARICNHLLQVNANSLFKVKHFDTHVYTILPATTVQCLRRTRRVLVRRVASAYLFVIQRYSDKEGFLVMFRNTKTWWVDGWKSI